MKTKRSHPEKVGSSGTNMMPNTRSCVQSYKLWPALFATLIILAVACSDNATGPEDEEIIGTWIATKIELTSRSNPALKVDLKEHGASATMIFESDGKWSLSVVDIPDEPDLNINGTWLSEGDVMTIHYSMFGFTSEWQFDMTLSGDILTLEGAHVDFDLTGDDQDEPALITFVLQRQ